MSFSSHPNFCPSSFKKRERSTILDKARTSATAASAVTAAAEMMMMRQQEQNENQPNQWREASGASAANTLDLVAPGPVMVSLLNNKGVIYIERRQYAQATKSLSRALRMAEKEGTSAPAGPERIGLLGGSGTTGTAATAAPVAGDDSTAADVIGWPNNSVRKELSSLSLMSVSSVESSDTSKTPFKHRAEYDEGMDYFRNPVRLGGEHPGSSGGGGRSVDGTILYNLARCHHNQGNYDNALCLYKRSLRSLEKWPVCDEPLILAILFGIGQIQYIRGDHSDSLKTYMTSLNFARSKFGPSSLEVAACMNCIGVLHYIMPKGDSATALEALQAAISLRTTILGDDHIDVGTTWNNIGRIYFQQAKYLDAMDAYRRALRIRRREQGDSVDVAATICTFCFMNCCRLLGGILNVPVFAYPPEFQCLLFPFLFLFPHSQHWSSPPSAGRQGSCTSSLPGVLEVGQEALWRLPSGHLHRHYVHRTSPA
jgi:tetratricopeptide (TPR) repeat protein